MVFQNQVYATGHSRGPSRHGSSSSGGLNKPQLYLPKSQKDFLEQHILQKREAEIKKLSFWSQTSDHYNRLARMNERYEQLTSPEVTKTSLEASNRKENHEKRKQHLLGRRQRLKALLAEEEAGYKAEIAALPPGVQPITDLREEREKMRREREEVMNKEAELKMMQHWKINNGRFRDEERNINSYNVRQKLQEQIREKKEKEERLRLEQGAFDRQMRDEEERKIRESLRLEEERKEELRNMHQELEKQMVELRQKEREMDVWKRTNAEQEELQRRVEISNREREELEKKRGLRELASFNKRQHKLKLRMRTKQVQESLEEDRKRLAEMEELTRAQDGCHEDKKRKTIEDVKWMREVIRQQQEEEQRREKEADTLFAEEAARMWSKQEEIWDREEKARRSLMEEVTGSWRQQMDKRTEAARLVVEHETQRMMEIEADIRDLHQHIQEKEKRQEDRRQSLVEALDTQVNEKRDMRMKSYQEQEAELVTKRREEIRDENRLARSLTQLNFDRNSSDTNQGSDFRRRKVRWFY